jgi:hypothetical protein
MFEKNDIPLSQSQRSFAVQLALRLHLFLAGVSLSPTPQLPDISPRPPLEESGGPRPEKKDR